MKDSTEIQKTKTKLMKFIVFSLLVIVSITQPSSSFLSLITIGLIVYLYVDRLHSLLLRINQNKYIRQLIKTNKGMSTLDLEKEMRPLKKQIEKKLRRISFSYIFILLIVAISFNLAYTPDSILVKSFVFTNIIFSFYILDKRLQQEDYFQKLFSK